MSLTPQQHEQLARHLAARQTGAAKIRLAVLAGLLLLLAFLVEGGP